MGIRPQSAFGSLRSFVAWSALALALAFALALALALALARVAAGAARRGLILERSGAERADYPVVLARGSGRRGRWGSGLALRHCKTRPDPADVLVTPRTCLTPDPADVLCPLLLWFFAAVCVDVGARRGRRDPAGAHGGGQVLHCDIAIQDLTPRTRVTPRTPDPADVRADAVVAHHGTGATNGVGARDSAACATASSCPVQPPDTPADWVGVRSREARASTSRTPKTQRCGRRSPAGAISGAPRSAARGSVRAAHFVIILAAVVRTQRTK